MIEVNGKISLEFGLGLTFLFWFVQCIFSALIYTYPSKPFAKLEDHLETWTERFKVMSSDQQLPRDLTDLEQRSVAGVHMRVQRGQEEE